MTRRLCIWLACVFALILIGVAPVTAEEQPTPSAILVEEVVAHPAGVATYEEAVKEMFALWKEKNFPYPCYTYSTDDLTYYFVYPTVTTLTQVDELFAAWEEFVKEWGQENLDAFTSKWAGTFDHYRMRMYNHRPKLSYVPAKQAVAMQDAKFFLWGFCDVIPGHEKKAEEIFKKFSALVSKHESQQPWQTWQTGFGGDMPGYVYMEWNSSAGAFWTGAEAMQEKLGDEGMKLWFELLKSLRGYHYVTGMFRPDLSYMPAPEEGSE